MSCRATCGCSSSSSSLIKSSGMCTLQELTSEGDLSPAVLLMDTAATGAAVDPPPLLFFHQNGITIFGPSRRCSLQLHLQDLNSSHTEIDGELSYCGVKTSLKALSSLIFSLSHAHKYTASKLNYI